jgi:hypothetical protein
MYDAQIGRFPQLDPLTDDYPYLTPYQYASNDPITNIDIDGLEGGSAVGASFSYSYKAASQADIFLTPANIISKTATVTRPAGSLLLVTKSAAVGGAAVASSANPLRVAAKQGVQQGAKQGAKVIAMNTAKSPGFWSKALPWAARSLNVAGWIFFTPFDAGPRAPHGDELYYYPGHPGYSPKFAPVPENNPKGKPDDDNDGNKQYLVRLGAEPESAEKLGEDAAKAEKYPRFGHGVSTTLKLRISGSDKRHRSALLSEVAKHFRVNPSPTANNPNHVTVILPKPVTKDVADRFNSLFKVSN